MIERVLQRCRAIFFPQNRPAKRQSPTGKLGTFLGVFTPTILTILGVIMYLRFGWVLGQVGLTRTLLIVVLANALTLITALCLSSVATNTRVGVGGAYYIISRSLGLEIGGAIGLPLFLSQVLSVTLYAFGLAESLRFVWPGIPVPIAAFVIILLVAALAFRGANAALRTQVPIMVLIGLSLAALAVGALLQGAPAESAPVLPATVGFWGVFAVFFPAVTGIMAGLSLSGDLAAPRQSIPRGTLLATLTGFGVYLLIPLLLAMGADTETLRADPLVWTRIAVLGPWLILPGLWGAIFSSAVGSMLGAPRTLQALSMDQLAPRFLARVTGQHQEPVFGLAVTLLLALSAVFLGDLNTVATVVTMFFLTVYGTVNLVAAFEKLSGNPSWRPRFDVPWPVSLAGALGCFAVMMLIHLPASILAITIELALWLLLSRRVRRERWGDVRRDLYEALIRWALVRLSRHPMTARNWRPHILVFCGSLERRLDLVRYADWFSEGRGVVTVCELVVGDLLHLDLDIDARERQMGEILDNAGIVAFAEVDVVQNIERGIVAVAQGNGIAGIQSNTVFLGWPDSLDRLSHFLRVIRRLNRLNQSLLLGRLHELPPEGEGTRRTVHVWWGGLERNGDLMLLLAYLLTRNPGWRGARIRIASIASNSLMKAKTETFLQNLIPEIRIEAEIEVMVKPEGMSVQALIQQESAEADLVLLGLAMPAEGEEEAYAKRLTELAAGLPSCIFVHNGSLFIGDLVTPESGDQGPPNEKAEL